MLWRAAAPVAEQRVPLNLTDTVNATRRLMAYDRKLRNAVAGSVRETLAKERITLRWRMRSHELQEATVAATTIRHLKCPELIEALHDRTFLAMVAELFGGTRAEWPGELLDGAPGKRAGAVFARLRENAGKTR